MCKSVMANCCSWRVSGNPTFRKLWIPNVTIGKPDLGSTAAELNDGRRTMYTNNKNQRSRNPLMFTLPACGFVVALNLDWLDDANPTPGFIETFAQRTKAVEADLLDVTRN